MGRMSPLLLLAVVALTAVRINGVPFGFELEACSPNPCQNNGLCSLNFLSPRGFSCVCLDGWGGHACDEQPSSGSDAACLNGGRFIPGSAPNTYTCACPDGWGGSRCEVPGECTWTHTVDTELDESRVGVKLSKEQCEAACLKTPGCHGYDYVPSCGSCFLNTKPLVEHYTLKCGGGGGTLPPVVQPTAEPETFPPLPPETFPPLPPETFPPLPPETFPPLPPETFPPLPPETFPPLPPETFPPLPPVTEPPFTEPPFTEPPFTEPPFTEPPFTEPPITEPPPTPPPPTQPPPTPPPPTQPPPTPPPPTQPPPTQPPPPVGPTEAPRCRSKLDLTIIVDVSSSICANQSKGCGAWQDNMRFIIDLTKALDVGPDQTRVAVIVFGTMAAVKWKLNAPQTTNNETLQAAILKIVHDGGNTRTDLALTMLVDKVFVVSEGDRPEVSNVAILITDGNPTRKDLIPGALQKVRTAERPIKVFAVGVTNEPLEESLKEISSDHTLNSTYFMIKSYKEASDISNILKRQFCAAA